MVLVRAQLYAVTFHQRGFEVATGILNRRKRFIWYYQLTEKPHYVRTPGMFVTHTASLQISYNDDAHTARRLELTGIGSPREVEAHPLLHRTPAPRRTFAHARPPDLKQEGTIP